MANLIEGLSPELFDTVQALASMSYHMSMRYQNRYEIARTSERALCIAIHWLVIEHAMFSFSPRETNPKTSETGTL
jgi:hypothetical protein